MPNKPDFVVRLSSLYCVTPHRVWGFILQFLNKDDPRPAREQFNEHYVSGWEPFDGFSFHPGTFALSHSGDPDMIPRAATTFRDEIIMLYPHDWVLILQKDGTWEVARMD